MNDLENNKMMFNPCHEYCFIRLGRQYEPEKCDSTCAYAKLAKDYKNISEELNSQVSQPCKCKPKDLQEVLNFIYSALKNKYGDVSRTERNQIIIDTETTYYGNGDVWIDLHYFH